MGFLHVTGCWSNSTYKLQEKKVDLLKKEKKQVNCNNMMITYNQLVRSKEKKVCRNLLIHVHVHLMKTAEGELTLNHDMVYERLSLH